jgi:SAM-dependent methyltransferase
MEEKRSFQETCIDGQESIVAGFARIHAEGKAPWELGRPAAPFIAVADKVSGPLLDVGCGSGNAALFFAARGLAVTAIDFVEEAIRLARAKATARGLSIDFLVKDAMTLGAWDASFSSIVDSGLFHIFHGEDQRRYVAGLAQVLQPGGCLFLYGFAKDSKNPGGGFSDDDVRAAFADGWSIESLTHLRGELNPAFLAEFPNEYPAGGPAMFFAVIRRVGKA